MSPPPQPLRTKSSLRGQLLRGEQTAFLTARHAAQPRRGHGGGQEAPRAHKGDRRWGGQVSVADDTGGARPAVRCWRGGCRCCWVLRAFLGSVQCVGSGRSCPCRNVCGAGGIILHQFADGDCADMGLCRPIPSSLWGPGRGCFRGQSPVGGKLKQAMSAVCKLLSLVLQLTCLGTAWRGVHGAPGPGTWC